MILKRGQINLISILIFSSLVFSSSIFLIQNISSFNVSDELLINVSEYLNADNFSVETFPEVNKEINNSLIYFYNLSENFDVFLTAFKENESLKFNFSVFVDNSNKSRNFEDEEDNEKTENQEEDEANETLILNESEFINENPVESQNIQNNSQDKILSSLDIPSNAVNITNCTTLSSANTYYVLNRSIEDGDVSLTGDCIIISAPNIIFD